MQNIEKEFNTYYLDQLNHNYLLPSIITEFFDTQACLVFSEAKSIYIVSDIIFSQKYILKQVSRQHLAQSEKEWDMLSSLDHPSIPKAYKRYSDDNYTYMIREYFDGMTLDAYVLGNGVVQEDEAVDLAIQVCDLLIYLHSQNPPVIHRDIKPQNLVLRPDGKIGLIDFETSRQYDLQAGSDTIYMGTLQTAAPEQFGYQQTNHQTDIYALGILLIYLETGSYDRANTCHMTPGLRKIAEKCTEFSPKDRYKSVDEVKKHLLSKRNFVFSKKMIVGLSALLIGSTIVFGILYAIHPARQAEARNNEEITQNEQAKGEKTKPTVPTNQEETETVSFKNPGIEKAVRISLSKTADEPLKKSEVEKIIYLELVGNLSESIGYNDFSHDFYMNRIAYKGELLERGPVDSLEDLAQLPYLIDLILMNQQITDLSGIEKLHHLQTLNLTYNYISDLTPLKDMEKLTLLRINSNPVKDLSPLKNLSKLELLEISATKIEDLTPLSSLQSLKVLGIWGMKNIDLSPLQGMENLKEIIQ